MCEAVWPLVRPSRVEDWQLTYTHKNSRVRTPLCAACMGAGFIELDESWQMSAFGPKTATWTAALCILEPDTEQITYVDVPISRSGSNYTIGPVQDNHRVAPCIGIHFPNASRQ